MERRDFIKKTSAGALGLNTMPYWQKVAKEKLDTSDKPNILMIPLDSVKAKALSVYGNKYCKTPTIDRLAKEGTTISHAFCALPKCMPNRAAMLTGRYIHTDGMRAITGKKEKEGNTKSFVINKDIKNGLKVLLEHGYNLCHKGINHIVDWDLYEQWFKYRTDWDDWDANRLKIPSTINDPELNRAMYEGPVPEDFDLNNSNDGIASRQMIDFIENYSEEAPFFAYLDLRAPHPTYRDYPFYKDHYDQIDVPVPQKASLANASWNERVYRETYDLEGMGDDKWKKIVKAYYTGISYADMSIGRVIEALEKKGMAENTIIIFTADHGDFAGDHGCVEKHDPLMFDSLTRLPFIIKWPKRIKAANKVETMIEQIDIAPTLMELCGIEVPNWVQGKSFMSVLTGESATHKDKVFVQGGVEKEAIDRTVIDRDEVLQAIKPQYYLKQKVIVDYPEFMMRTKMVRTMDYKYTYRLNGKHELYDMKKDPEEVVNQVDNPAYKKVVLEMREHLIRFMLESETNLPEIQYAKA